MPVPTVCPVEDVYKLRKTNNNSFNIVSERSCMGLARK